MQRFNVEKGKMIYTNEGDFMLSATHNKIVDALHTSFNLQNIKIPQADLLVIVEDKSAYKVINIADSVNGTITNNSFLTYEQHKVIMQTVENQLFSR